MKIQIATDYNVNWGEQTKKSEAISLMPEIQNMRRYSLILKAFKFMTRPRKPMLRRVQVVISESEPL